MKSKNFVFIAILFPAVLVGANFLRSDTTAVGDTRSDTETSTPLLAIGDTEVAQ